MARMMFADHDPSAQLYVIPCEGSHVGCSNVLLLRPRATSVLNLVMGFFRGGWCAPGPLAFLTIIFVVSARMCGNGSGNSETSITQITVIT
jgi:hypothetical protein